MRISVALALATLLVLSPQAHGQPQSNSSQIISIQCQGVDKLIRSSATYVFHIDLEKMRFSGQKDSIANISGSAYSNGNLITLMTEDAAGTVTFRLDRASGTFKADRSTSSGLYLFDNITGSCQKFTGNAF